MEHGASNHNDHHGRGGSKRPNQHHGGGQRKSDRPRRGKGHAQRAGKNRRHHRNSGPQSPRYRENRQAKLSHGPAVPDDIDIKDLDPAVLQDLRVLSKGNADTVAKHLIMAATLMEEDPALALEHARAAKERGGRVAVTRETNGIAAYRAGKWREALSELRAARRMSGGPGLLAVMADCERGLGRPEKAIGLSDTEEVQDLDPVSAVEFTIVIAGAYRDLQRFDEALAYLKDNPCPGSAPKESAARYYYALADAYLDTGDADAAQRYFAEAATRDEFGELNAEERAREAAQAQPGTKEESE